ncbi:MAG: glycosyltransferase family 39 protein [Rhodospirillaceae bacterium]|nr:glycosyltransferase family 39 protein [Rhodospirillaceae bacterium]
MANRTLSLWQMLLLLAVAFVVFWPGQTDLPPIDRDESRYIQATVQMLESGDFIDIRFQDHPRYQQPVGIYWLQSAAVWLLSDPADREVWAHRVVSLLGAMAAVLMTAVIGARLFGPRIGMLAGMLFTATVLLGIEARLAKTDAMLLVAILVAIYGILRAYELRDVPERVPWPWAMAFWAALACGVMIKGPVVLMVAGLTGLALVVLERRFLWLFALRPIAGVALFFAMVLPWFIAIDRLTDGAFFARSAGDNMFDKLFSGQQGHGAPPGTYLLMGIGTLWPMGQGLVLAVPWIWRQRKVPEVRFCLAWAVPFWVTFEIIVTKLPHYILASVPALAILTAAAIGTLGPTLLTHGRWARFWRYPVLVGFVGVGVGLAVIPAVLRHWLDGGFDIVAIAAALVGLLAVFGAVRALFQREIAHVAWTAPLLTLLVFSFNMLFVMPRVDTIFFYREIAPTAAAVAPCADYQVMAAPLDLESVVYLNGTDTVLEDTELLAAALRGLGDRCAVMFLTDDAREAVFAEVTDPTLELAYTGRRVGGFNFSNGRWYDLGVYTARRRTSP